MRSWTTACVINADPFGSWGDDLAQAFVRLEPKRVSDAPFSGRIVKAESGPVEVSRVDAGAHQVLRQREHIDRAPGDTVFVNLQISGVGIVSQHGGEVRARPFDIAVVDTDAPFWIRHGDRFALYSIAAPRGLVPPFLLDVGHLPLSSDEPGRQISTMLANYARMSLRDGTPADINAIYGRHIVDLLNVAVHQMRPGPSAARRDSARLPLLRDYIRQNYADNLLSAANLCRVFGISERYVYKIFADAGTTVSEFIREVRLDQCALRLAAAAERPRSIADIAFGAGFSDLSYFNRCFKSRFGETPSAYRRRTRHP